MLQADELRLLKLIAPDEFGRDPSSPPLELTPGRRVAFQHLERGGYCRFSEDAPLPLLTAAGRHVLQLLHDYGLAVMLMAEHGESIKPQM